jgi:hypothetical protein
LQRRKRYSRGWSSAREAARYFATPSFQRINFLFLLSFVSFTIISCAHQRNLSDESQQQSLAKEIAKICLDAEGKARLEIGSNKYLFNFESVLKSEESSWLVAAHIPLQGEELMGIKYLAGEESQIVGSFLYRMRDQAEQKGQKNKSKISLLDYKLAFSKFGQLLFFLDEVKKDISKLSNLCHAVDSNKDNKSFSCFVSKDKKDQFSLSHNQGQLVFQQILSKEKKLELTFSNPSQSTFDKMQLSFKGQKQNFEMIFFLNACTKSM